MGGKKEMKDEDGELSDKNVKGDHCSEWFDSELW